MGRHVTRSSTQSGDADTTIAGIPKQNPQLCLAIAEILAKGRPAFYAAATQISFIVPRGHSVCRMFLGQRQRLRTDATQNCHQALDSVEVAEKQALGISSERPVQCKDSELPPMHRHFRATICSQANHGHAHWSPQTAINVGKI